MIMEKPKIITKKLLREWLIGVQINTNELKNMNADEFIKKGESASKLANETMDFLNNHNCLNPNMKDK